MAKTMLNVLYNISIYKYFEASGIILILYDYPITLSREVEWIWKVRWSLMTWVFLVIRYLPFVDIALTLFEETASNPAPSVCKTVLSIQSWLYVVGITISAGVLLVRTYAIWRGSMKVAWGFTVLGVAMFVSAGYALQRFIDSVVLGASPSPQAFPGCFVVEATDIIWFTYLSFLIFETLIFVMTLYKLLVDENLRRTSELARTIYRDGVVFYVYLLCISVVNIVTLKSAPAELKTCLTGIHRSMHAVLAERIILNIRAIGTGKLEPTDRPEESHGLRDISFTERIPIDISRTNGSGSFFTTQSFVQTRHPSSG